MTVATVPTACGIETKTQQPCGLAGSHVATVPTACGIETFAEPFMVMEALALQQYLPLAVLKLGFNCSISYNLSKLQQYLPLAVLKRASRMALATRRSLVATVPTACGIETLQ